MEWRLTLKPPDPEIKTVTDQKLSPMVNQRACVACGACEALCEGRPNVFVLEGVIAVVHPAACTGCGVCVEVCPVEAIAL